MWGVRREHARDGTRPFAPSATPSMARLPRLSFAIAAATGSAVAVGPSSFDAPSADARQYMSHYAADYEKYMSGVNPSGSGSDSYERYMAPASVATSRNAVGCCYSIGFGDRMAPVDLTTSSITRSACLEGRAPELDGGARGWSPICPQSAAEAAEWAQAASSPPELAARPSANSTLCAAQPKCVQLNLVGDCCPTSGGAVLDCCSIAAAPSPPAVKGISSLCSAHRACRGHDGHCCPTGEGAMLYCCSEGSAEVLGDFEAQDEQEQTSGAEDFGDFEAEKEQEETVQELVEPSTRPAVVTLPVVFALASVAVFTTSLGVASRRRGQVQSEAAREPLLLAA